MALFTASVTAMAKLSFSSSLNFILSAAFSAIFSTLVISSSTLGINIVKFSDCFAATDLSFL